MQALDCFDANGDKVEVRDVVWCVTAPHRVLKIVSQKEYQRITRERRANQNEDRIDFYQDLFKKDKKWYVDWVENHGEPVPTADWNDVHKFDTFEEYWEYKKIKWREPGPEEFPENKIPMLYLSFFQRDDSMDCYGFWEESIKVFKDPTKIPLIFHDRPVRDVECDLDEIKKEFLEMSDRIEEQSYIKRKKK